MLWLYSSISLTLLVFTPRNQALENAGAQMKKPTLEKIKSPMLEMLVHFLPDVRSFNNTQQKLKRPEEFDSKWNQSIVNVRNYVVTQPVLFKNLKSTSKIINKRDTESKRVEPILEESKKLVSSLVESQDMLPLPQPIRGSIYTTYPVKEFDVVDVDDPDEPKRRRNDTSDDPEYNSQRDKRTFLDEGSGETTTTLPFWKRKKESPPFVTGRGGPVQSGNGYTPAQHRSENARESHSLKNLEKTVQSNEITRSNQDSYYSATNRRTYGRQYDKPLSSTPKSVYDTIDYVHQRSQGSGRAEFGRNQDNYKVQDSEKKGTPRPTLEQYTNRFPYNIPWTYDRSYYQPPYPYPTEVFGRGVEYYHRTFDPTTGRIIYYANMPEHGRSYEYGTMDPINRNFYVNRPYYDPYNRNYVPPTFDYRYVNGYGRFNDHSRNGRSSSYSSLFPEREKFPKDVRVNAAFETGNRMKDEFRNKTYIIYDADERITQYPRPQYAIEDKRSSYTPPSYNLPGPPLPFRQLYPTEYFSPAIFPFRNQFYPSSHGHSWVLSQRSAPGVTDSNSNSKPRNSPEIQLALTTSNRGALEKSKKS